MQVRMRVRTSISDPLNGYLEDDSKYTSNNIVLVQSEQQTAKQEILDYYNVAKNYTYEIGNDEIGWQTHYILVEGNYLISIVGTTVDIYTITQLLSDTIDNFGTIEILKNELFGEGQIFDTHMIFGTSTTDTNNWTGKEFIFPSGIWQTGLQIKAHSENVDFTVFNNIVNAISGKSFKSDIYNSIKAIIG